MPLADYDCESVRDMIFGVGLCGPPNALNVDHEGKMMQQPSAKLCKYLRLERKRLSGVGQNQQRLLSLQRCTLLESLQNSNATQHAEACAKMHAAGGKSGITTLCEFNGLPPCPVYEKP